MHLKGTCKACFVNGPLHLHYAVYGQRLCSMVALPELPSAEFTEGDMQFRLATHDDSNTPPLEGAAMLSRHNTNLGCDLSVFEIAEGILLRWHDHCDFRISRDGRLIQCCPNPSVGLGWIQSTLYGMVLSYALHLMGVRNLHASAVVLPQGAVGFMADPGSGKSTMAAAFARAGYPFLTDDVLALKKDPQGYVAQPGFPYVSLSPNSIRGLLGDRNDLSQKPLNQEKQRVAVDGEWASFQREPAHLGGLFLLRRSSETHSIALERLPKVDAIKGLMENTNCIPILPLEVQRQHMSFVAQLTADVPAWRLTYATGFEHTPRIIERVIEEVRERIET